ncbi:MAG: ZIP family metal transporter, partial [Acetobacteraceae bacterium]
MSDFWTLLLLALLPPFGCIAGALAAELTTVSRRWLSASLHAAVGIAVAVIAVELMPRALRGAPVWAVAVGFAAGGLAAILISRGMTRYQSSLGTHGDKGPWMVYLAVGSDLFSDGVMVGVGSAVSSGLGLLLAIGQVAGNLPEGFATIANFKDAKLARRRRILLA